MATPLEIVRKKRTQAVNRIVQRGFLRTTRVYVGMATCEIAAGSRDTMAVFEQAIDEGLQGVYLSRKGCAGRCNLEPMVEVVRTAEAPVKYCRVSPEMAREIVERHLKQGEVIHEWTIQ